MPHASEVQKRSNTPVPGHTLATKVSKSRAIPPYVPGVNPPGWPLISALNLSSELKVRQIFMIFIVSWYNPVQFAHSICQHSLKMFLIYFYYFYGHVRLLPSTRLCLIILCNNNLLHCRTND